MYLPKDYTHGTKFPGAISKDLQTQIRMIEERWIRFYPQVEYHAFSGDVRPTTNPAGTQEGVLGEAGGSAFDSLWGETVDAAQISTGVWKQPHRNAGSVAANPEIRYPMQRIHARVKRESREKELKQYAFDQIRDLTVDIPLSLLDAAGITCRPDDEFVWDGYRYVVMQTETTGYWKNTNIRLFMTLYAEHARSGS